MVVIFKIKNPETKQCEELNEVLILRILKVLNDRNKPLYNNLKEKYENLIQKKIEEEDLIF